MAIRNRQDADAVAAAAPKVELVVEYVSGNLYRLRNVGKLAAKSVTTDLTGLEEFADELPTGVDLGPGEHAGGEVEGAVTAAGRRGASRRPAVPTR